MAVIATPLIAAEPYANGATFGSFGPFESAKFDIVYAVSPNDDANKHIVDIQHAPIDQAGLVRFEGNARLVYPKYQPPTALLVDIPNRGRPTAFSFNRPKPSELQNTSTPVGDGFLCRHGFAVLSVGWQFDAEGLNLNVPEAIADSRRIRGDAICQMQPNRDTDSLLVGQGGVFTYPPTGVGRLFERPNVQAQYQEIPASSWRFGKTRDDDTDPPRYIAKDGGFTKGVVYTLVYETEGAPVVGLGLLAVRDAAAWFMHEHAWGHGNPPFAIGYGASQTGRFLRHFLYEGMNADEKKRPVFDLVMPHIAGGQRGDFNHRFAQPGSMGIPALGQRFPFANRVTQDALTQETKGSCEKLADPPKVISTNTSWEYWRGDAALIHAATDGQQDIDPEPNERIYLFAGTHHINGVLPLTDRFMLTGERVPYPLNTISYTPLLRAALLNALAWLRDEVEPPPSRYPKREDGTLVSRERVIERFAQEPRFRDLPLADNLPSLWVTDLGSQTDDGICRHPARLLQPYPVGVAAVDDSLNEVAGIRLPEVAVPIGIHSGWNPRHADHGAPDQTATFAGFSVFEPPARVPPDRATCIAAVEQVTDQLVAERYVLAEDRSLVIDNALKRFDIALETIAKHQESHP